MAVELARSSYTNFVVHHLVFGHCTILAGRFNVVTRCLASWARLALVTKHLNGAVSILGGIPFVLLSSSCFSLLPSPGLDFLILVVFLW